MNIEAAAEYLRLSRSTLIRMDKSGKLVPERRGNRRGVGDRWYFKEQLDKYLEAHATK